jgi:hypothetical protein
MSSLAEQSRREAIRMRFKADIRFAPVSHFCTYWWLTSRRSPTVPLTGGFIGWRRCWVRWRCGSRDFAAPSVVMARRVSVGCRIAGPRQSSTECEHMFLL